MLLRIGHLRMLGLLKYRSVRGSELFIQFSSSQENCWKRSVLSEDLLNQISSFEENYLNRSVRIIYFIGQFISSELELNLCITTFDMFGALCLETEIVYICYYF